MQVEITYAELKMICAWMRDIYWSERVVSVEEVELAIRLFSLNPAPTNLDMGFKNHLESELERRRKRMNEQGPETTNDQA